MTDHSSDTDQIRSTTMSLMSEQLARARCTELRREAESVRAGRVLRNQRRSTRLAQRADRLSRRATSLREAQIVG